MIKDTLAPAVEATTEEVGESKPPALPEVAGVHAICAALLGKKRGIQLTDAK